MKGVRILLEQAGPKSTVYFWVGDIDAAFNVLALATRKPHPA